MSVENGRIVESIPEGFVFIEIHQDWLVRLLRVGVTYELRDERV